MAIVKATILGLRGFGTPQVVQFAVPNGKPGSGLTIIVGPNGAGKSTVIEAVGFLRWPKTPPQFGEALRNARSTGKVSIELIDDSGAVSLLGTNPAGGGDVTWRKWNTSLNEGTIFVIPPRRALVQPTFQNVEEDRGRYMASQQTSLNRLVFNQSFGPRLVRMHNHKAEVDDLLRRLIDDVPQWAVEPVEQTGQYRLRFYAASGPHLSDGMAEGIVSLLFLADGLYDSKPGALIAIDEPELSLHADVQRRLADLLAEFGRDRQIVYATHSPHLVDWSYVLDGAQVVRVVHRDSGSTVFNLSRNVAEGVRGLLQNYPNPHVLGTDARDVFFLRDGVILVEGQEDVVGYGLIAEQLAFEIGGQFYGWGVGGASSMSTIASVLRDLGFQQVVGVLDADQGQQHRALCDEFPMFRFVLSTAADVRTKPAQQRAERPGLLDKSWRLPADRKEEAAALLREVNAALAKERNSPGGGS